VDVDGIISEEAVAQLLSLEAELGDVAVEIAEVREALETRSKFLGMSAPLLQEYFVELTKKQNLLRLTVSRLQHWPIALPIAPVRRSVKPPTGAGCLQVLRPGNSTPAGSPSLAARSPLQTPLSKIPLPLKDADAAKPASPSLRQRAESFATPCTADQVEGASTSSTACASSSGKTEAFLQEVDCSNLAAVLQFMQTCSDDTRALRLGVHAIGRLARDEAQLQPQCLAATASIVNAAATVPADRQLQRLAVASLSSIAYSKQVAAVILGCALPAILSTMILNADDQRLQGLALEGLARLAQAGREAVVHGLVQVVLHDVVEADEAKTRKVCCESLLRLRESEICDQLEVVSVLLPITEANPANLHLQRRACQFMNELILTKAVDDRYATRAAASLTSPQWAHLLARFASAGTDELTETSTFHARVQRLFHEEVGKHFEFEAAERTLHLLRRKSAATQRLQEVIRCMVENLEDYQHRLRTRKVAWDENRRCLAPLTPDLFEHLTNQAVEHMELGLHSALVVASTAEEGPSVEASLSRRAAVFRAECAALLATKTEMTQTHQERMESLRREVMLYEAVEYLELNAPSVSTTQIRTTLHMLNLMDGDEAPEGLDRLRKRINALSAARKGRAVPAG